MKKKKVKAPVYEEFKDNEYIGGLREDLPGYRDYANQLLYGLDVTSPEMQNKFNEIANDYTQSMWGDLNRGYLQNMNALNQRNYNRFGSLGSTGALYGQESAQRDYNDMASRLASQTAAQYQNLINNYYNQKLNTYNAANNAYQNAGNQTTNIDLNNWQLRNNNIAAKYAADVQNANQQNPIIRTITGALNGAGTGGSIGGGWGALAGGLIGGASAAFDTSGQEYNLNMPMIGQGFSSMFNSNSGSNGLNLNTKNPNTVNTYMGGAYRW